MFLVTQNFQKLLCINRSSFSPIFAVNELCLLIIVQKHHVYEHDPCMLQSHYSVLHLNSHDIDQVTKSRNNIENGIKLDRWNHCRSTRIGRLSLDVDRIDCQLSLHCNDSLLGSYLCNRLRLGWNYNGRSQVKMVRLS